MTLGVREDARKNMQKPMGREKAIQLLDEIQDLENGMSVPRRPRETSEEQIKVREWFRRFDELESRD